MCIVRVGIYRAHRAVIFVIAKLSCLMLIVNLTVILCDCEILRFDDQCIQSTLEFHQPVSSIGS